MLFSRALGSWQNFEHKRISVSFSGGRTSGMMAYIMKNFAEENGWEIIFTFANTGLEHPGTYDFVNECSDRWGLDVKWIETKVNPERGKGIRHRVVDYDTYTKGPRLFREMAAKYGLPCQASPFCTTYLKVYPMEDYIKSIGWKKKQYLTCIGIRSDEIDRMNSRYKDYKLCYPLIHMGYTKDDVMKFWREQPFDLDIPENYGNCITCWKKSKRKLFDIYSKTPEDFKPFLELERDFHTTEKISRKGERVLISKKMYRGNKSFKELLTEIDDVNESDLDVSNGCEESCEVYSEEHLKILSEGEL